MKKSVLIITSIIAAVSFTNCSKEFTPAAENATDSQKIYLNVGPQTKTTYDGATTTWNEDDSISVFVCDHGTASSVKSWKNLKFKCEDASTGKFSCSDTTLSATGSYDLYAFYPYYKSWTTPASASMNIAYNQKIDGIAGTINGKNEPLWGAQTEGQSADAFSVTMKQVATFFRFAITAAEETTISSISLTAPEKVYLGTQIYINGISEGKVSDGKASYQTNSVSATVSNGKIAAGATGIFNVAVRPFSLTSGQELECAILTSDGKKMTVTVTAPAAGYDFAAGKINKIARDFKEDEETATAIPYEESFSASLGDFTTKNVTIPSNLTYVWNWNSSKYAKASAYVSNTSYATESWLVSPLLDLTNETKAFLSFTYAINKGTAPYDDNFYIVVSDGTNETKISIANLPTTGSWTFYDTDIDLSAYCGKKVSIALVYKSTSSSAPTVEVKNFAVRSTKNTTLAFANATVAVEKGSTVTNAATTNSTATVTYSSSDPSIATVDANGVITGVKAGTTTITASIVASDNYAAMSTTCSVTVSDASASSWTRITSVADLLAGGTCIIGYEATANSGVIVPMQNNGTATTSAAGILYSGTTSGSSSSSTIDMSSVTDTDLYEVTIAASTTVDGAITIKCGNNYVGNTNTKNNLKLFTAEATTTSFTPTLGTNDVFTLKITANESYTTLQYNSASGSQRFAVYGGTQKNVVIYKKK